MLRSLHDRTLQRRHDARWATRTRSGPFRPPSQATEWSSCATATWTHTGSATILLLQYCVSKGDICAHGRSDGPQPHLVNIQFHKKTRVQEIEIYTDYKLDESYTPANISVRAGTTFHDIQEVHSMELDEPSGWMKIPLAPKDPEPGQPRCFLHHLLVGPLAWPHR